MVGDITGEIVTPNIADVINVGEVIDVIKDAIDGKGFDWRHLIASLLGLGITGIGWGLSHWKSSKKSVLLGTVYEAGQCATSASKYFATGKKEDFAEALKEAKDLVLVPKKLLDAMKEEHPIIPS